MSKEIRGETDMISYGKHIGSLLSGGEIIELTGDVGTGKTTLVKGLAASLGIDDKIQSPSFTISRVYSTDNGLTLAHYDFYRLDQPGIMSEDLNERISDPQTVTVIEWGGVVEGVLPRDRLTINIKTTREDTRMIEVQSAGQSSDELRKKVEQ